MNSPSCNPKSRCKDLCRFEANIAGSGYDRYDAKCRTCHIALNSDKLRCYCCNTKLSRRKSLNDNLERKEALIVRID